MFEKILSTIGIGNVKINTYVETSKIKPGEIVSGRIHIIGGKTEQKIENIYLKLSFNYFHIAEDMEYRESDYLVQIIEIGEVGIVQENEKKDIPFSFRLPNDLVVSTANSTYQLHTLVQIPYAPDPVDLDSIVVYNSDINKTIKKIKEMGFKEKQSSGKVYSIPRNKEKEKAYQQIFKFIPHTSEFGIEQMNVVFTVHEKTLFVKISLFSEEKMKEYMLLMDEEVQVKILNIIKKNNQ